MSATTVHVKGISPQTEDKEIRDFFSFCGKITSLDVKTEGDTKSAEVTFGKLPPRTPIHYHALQPIPNTL